MPDTTVKNKMSRSTKIGLIILICITLYTILGFFIIPLTVKSILPKKLSEAINRPVFVERITLNPYKLTAAVEKFSILDKDGDYVGVWYSAIRAAAVDIDRSGRIVKLAPIRTATIGDQEP